MRARFSCTECSSRCGRLTEVTRALNIPGPVKTRLIVAPRKSAWNTLGSENVVVPDCWHSARSQIDRRSPTSDRGEADWICGVAVMNAVSEKRLSLAMQIRKLPAQSRAAADAASRRAKRRTRPDTRPKSVRTPKNRGSRQFRSRSLYPARPAPVLAGPNASAGAKDIGWDRCQVVRGNRRAMCVPIRQ